METGSDMQTAMSVLENKTQLNWQIYRLHSCDRKEELIFRFGKMEKKIIFLCNCVWVLE
jgi:hypothetical protein